MSWETIKAKVQFWDAVNGVTWPLVAGQGVTDVPIGAQIQILGYLEAIYLKSGTARDFLEMTLLRTDFIRIGTAANGEVAFGTYATVPYIGIDLSKIPLTFYMNDRGLMTAADSGLAIMHEMQHMVWGFGAQDPNGSDLVANGAGYEHDGRPVTFQNTVAREMGWFESMQSSYASGMADYALPGGFVDSRPLTLKRNHSYTNGEQVAITRFGDAVGEAGAQNILDQRARGNSNDLIIGFGGDDTLYGGAGRDFIYGGDDNDLITGGAGNDEIWGGLDEDLGLSDGMDKADYSAAPSSITVTFDGTSATPSLTVQDGEGGTDTLHSIEEIIASTKHDIFKFSGSIPASTKLTIKANGGGETKQEVISAIAASSGIVFHNSNSGGTLKTQGSSGQIKLVGFHTDIIGSPSDDEIVDDASGPKSIDGGAGDDKISVSIGAATIRGGDGDDELKGGDANDVLVGGSGANLLEGHGGSDRAKQ